MSIAETVYEKLKAAPPDLAQKVLEYVEYLESKWDRPPAGKPKSWDDVMGILKDSKVFAGDPVEIQRKLRDEWD